MHKFAFIINPVAGKGAGQDFYNKIKELPIIKNHDVVFFLTKRPKHAEELASKLSEQFQNIIVCGGDGTLHEVVNGFDIDSNSLLGLIPIGSGNDFSLAFHTKHSNPSYLLNRYLSDEFSIKSVDFGNVSVTDSNGSTHQRRMINSFGTGFDAKVAYYNQTNKTFSGSLSYIYSIIKALFEFNKIDFSANIDGKMIDGNSLFCAVGNGKTIGGGLYLIPDGIIDDGKLNLSVVTINSRLKLLTLLPKAMKNQLNGRKELEQFPFQKLSIELKNPFYAHLDGEIISDKAKFIDIEISNKKINFIL